MQRRTLIKAAAGLPLLPALGTLGCATSGSGSSASVARVRPGDPGWPSALDWDNLNHTLGGRLITVQSPLVSCVKSGDEKACAALFTELANPYAISDDPGLTQNLGWVDAWTFAPSVYAVAARDTADVVAAVNFAREYNLRLVIKGGGHGYQGGSNCADSLLVWTRKMSAVTVHDAFVAQGCGAAPEAAVSVEAGAVWSQVYDAVTVAHGRYVQGGGCTTVGVAGFIQGGGFGSFSKRYGCAAASLLEAEIVTADGVVRIANACTNPELFWALKGGGAGTLGVVTRVTLKTHELPEFFGGVNAKIQAHSDAAYRRLIEALLEFAGAHLVSPEWGEQISFYSNNRVEIHMVFSGLDRDTALKTWDPIRALVEAAPQDFVFTAPLSAVAIPAHYMWNPAVLKKVPGLIGVDERPGALASSMYWAGDGRQAGQILYAYSSLWLSQSLLNESSRRPLADALYAATREWGLSLHFNKGLAGAPAQRLAEARATSVNPAMIDAFALAIIAADAPTAYPGLAGHEPDLGEARQRAQAVQRSMSALRAVVRRPGSYFAESDYFEKSWQDAFWGDHYARLVEIKRRVDPDGLFFVHHGVDSERWSADGFKRIA